MAVAASGPKLILPTGRWTALLTIGGTALVILIVMNPWLIISANTPTGGDMGAHVLAPAFLRDVLLPQGQIQGWSNDWYAGFPIYYFYFPLPSLVIVLLDLVMPYGVAFKIVTVLGLIGLPAATFFLSRSLRLGSTVSAVTAAAAATFVFMESFNIYGANIASTLAGEFSFSWSFTLSLVYLGFLVRAVRDDRKYLTWAAVALAATALSHVLTTIVVVLASIPILWWKDGARRTVSAWVWGFAIAAIWALPLVARIGLSSDMAWTPLRSWDELLPIEIWLLLPLAIVGMVWAGVRTPRVAPLITATLIPVIYYPLPTALHDWLPDVFVRERWKLWNGRLLPYWYFGVVYFAAVAVGAGATYAARRLPDRISRWWPRGLAAAGSAVAVYLMARPDGQLPNWLPWAIAVAALAALATSVLWEGPVSSRSVLTVTAAAVLGLGGLAGVAFVDGWARWNYQGYESKDRWPEYQALMEEVSSLPPGRIQWEANNKALDPYGTPMSLMLFPYWSEGHTSMEGLFFESSLTTPFHFLNTAEVSQAPSNPIPGLEYHTFQFERALPHLDLYGVDYYVSVTPEATATALESDGFTKVTESGPFTIFELPDSPLVEVAVNRPVVYEAPSDSSFGRLLRFVGRFFSSSGATPRPTFQEMALDWYDDTALLDTWVVADGPDGWPRIHDVSDITDRPVSSTGTVSDVVVEDEFISFHTTAVGVPHLIKVSYFPNWKAEGADGPWRASPSLMVVVPTQPDVTLEFGRTWAEWGGLSLTALGVLALVSRLIEFFRRKRTPYGLRT